MLSDTALADAARYCDNDLALVLGERLHDLLDVDDELEAARDTIKELQLKVDLLTCELHDMEGTNLV
jgi:hypothetical protein